MSFTYRYKKESEKIEAHTSVLKEILEQQEGPLFPNYFTSPVQPTSESSSGSVTLCVEF